LAKKIEGLPHVVGYADSSQWCRWWYAARQEISAALVEIAVCSIDAFQFTIVDEESTIAPLECEGLRAKI
jgi:hypothetical protein